MKTNKHIIQKQVFEMRGYSKRPGFEWEQSVADHYRSVIAPGIEECFDALPVTDEHLVIDSIDIDLGVFTHESFVNEGRERLVSLLGEHLLECRRKAVAEKEKQLREMEENPKENVFQKTAPETLPGEQVLELEMAEGEALLYFLKEGNLPWWFTAPENLFTPSVLSNKSIIPRLQQLLRREEAAMIRASRHFPDETMLALLEHFVKDSAIAKRGWEIFSKTAQQYPAVFPFFRQRFWTMWLRAKEEIPHQEAITHLFAPFDEKFIAAMYEACLEVREDEHFEIYAALLEPALTGEKKLPEKGNADEASADGDREKIKRNPGEETPASVISPAEKEIEARGKPALDEAIYVEAAGLVLLHPFFTELFSSTGLWQENRWCSRAAPFKAVQLLSFLTYGEGEMPEYRLAFHKLLTGMDAATPLPTEAPLQPEETATCTELLEAVLRHWPALRNTGVDGLREGFLLRNGKVEQTPDGLKMDVERLAQDVLLARLPWGFSTVKLPWLEPLLTVNWI
ncbi:contractile injection system tape measure protein [Chitinophaga sp. GCM10012297]|uniref:Uncharacterized protein n=1 Tax=Chitinophaga chungangae TaxID=2821488 RepID=A0ABS3Y7M7_9BACT|nr:contractile injection system tape measure protein [Chitinophaga chungangae]MBO9150678.1 hypothetical protein [Chitinophaga chungangae]